MISFARAVETGVCSCAEKVKVHICVPKEKKSGGAAEAALGSLGVNIIINDSVSPGTPHLLSTSPGFFGSAPPFCPRYRFST